MIRGVSYCAPGTNAAAAAEIMLTRDCDVLLVLEGGEIAGIVTDLDLLLVLSTQGQTASDLPVARIMRRAADVFREEEPGALQGIVSMNDALIHASRKPMTSSGTT
jgi:CBS domain-containing protein